MNGTSRTRISPALVLLSVLLPGTALAQEPVRAPPPGSMTFALTGDAIITRRLSPYREPGFLGLVERIRSADAAFTNLEVLLHTYEEGYPAAHSGGTWMAAEPGLAKELAWAGFDLVSRANNHTMDYGVGGLVATTRAVEAAGLVHAGAGMNLALARAPAYLETAGGRVALISVASTFSDEDRAGPQRKDLRGRPGLSPLRYRTTWVVSEEALAKLQDVAREVGLPAGVREGRLRFLGRTFVAGDPPGRRTEVDPRDLEEILQAVREARRQADWVLVTSHSHEGGRSFEVPADFVVSFAHAVVDAGADLFVGHGPHVLRGVELRNGRPIFYSLGNFIFQNETVRFLPQEFYEQYGLGPEASPAEAQDARLERSRGGGFPAVRSYWESVVAVPRFEEGELTEILLYPVTLGFGLPRPRRGRPVLAPPDEGRRIIERLAELSRPFGTRIEYRAAENVGVIRP